MSSNRRTFLQRSVAVAVGFGTAAGAQAEAEKEQIHFDEVYDVIVVGSGISGSLAALAAAETGDTVLLIEKLNRLGGTSQYSGLDFACVGSAEQIKQGIRDTPEAMVADMAKVAGNLADTERALNIARNTARVQRFMLDRGVKWKALLKLGGHNTKRCLVAEGGGAGMLRTLWSCFDKHPNLTVYSATKLDDLIMSDLGAVVGVRARRNYLFDIDATRDDLTNKSGTPCVLGARKGVIMATGGYSRDKEFMKHEVPFLEHTAGSSSEGNTAGALKAMIRIGARPVQLSLYRFSFALPTEDLIWGMAVDAVTGERYASEGLGRNAISAASLAVRAKSGKKPYIIFDEHSLSKFHNMMRVARSLSGLNGIDGTLYKFETLEALAQHFGTSPMALQKSVKHYNAQIVSGRDELFNKPLERSGRRVEPIVNGPFYAAYMTPRWDYCPGGICTDTSARALSLFDTAPIEGLYVVGEAAGGIHGSERLTACSMPDCVVTGLIAAEQVCARKAKEI